ncbi:hypothetical protein [Asticcacaulis taihuensis]|jgi:hypothetical protein|uniref:hypothetical protein n=1 Tax=Asticcacaulis taihuensis TaxID=260084 RepID=UPI0026EE241B|nr:hypothetical protein [Asticcacaulis taihuensis]
MIIHFVWVWLSTILLVGSCLWAFWRGEAAERWGGGILLIGFGLTVIAQICQPKGVYDGAGIVAVDVAGLLAFVILSLWSRRIWTLFIAAFQLNAVISHFAVHLSSHVDMYTQITAVGLWGGYAITFALMAGMWQVERRRLGRN